MEEKDLIHVGLQLKRRYKEYKKETGEIIKFTEFLKLMQYDKKDINLIVNTMTNASKEHCKKKSEHNQLVRRIRSYVPYQDQMPYLIEHGYGTFNTKWEWSEEDAICFKACDNSLLNRIIDWLKNHTSWR